MLKQTLNVRGQLLDLSKPIVMGIVNVTPDSFYSASRASTEELLRERLTTIRDEGAAIVDLGAYSSRPGADHVTTEEERRRLEPALRLLRDEYPELAVSVDTFRADVARWAVEEYGVGIINDISGGLLDKNMYRTVVDMQVPYILMHMRGTPETMQTMCDYEDVGLEVLDFFIEQSEVLRGMGLHDLILDPGYGFAKTLEQNYALLGYLPRFIEALELPILVGVSRKSMIYRALDISPEESLNGTSVLNTYALLQGANILRVHDVKAAVEAVKLVELIKSAEPAQENIVETLRRPLI